MSNEPTLAQFAKALDAVRAKYPDAPGLPEGHSLIHIYDDEWWMSAPQLGGEMLRGDSPAALALCVTTAMEIGAWWRQGECRAFSMRPRDAGEWVVYLDDQHGYKARTMIGPSLPSAALAMLEVIGGVD